MSCLRPVTFPRMKHPTTHSGSREERAGERAILADRLFDRYSDALSPLIPVPSTCAQAPAVFFYPPDSEVHLAGINLPFYNFKAVTLLTGLDNSSGMLAQAGSKVSRMHKSGSVELLQGSVESMPFDSESFDTVVDTFSLCVYQQPLTALKEMARVLKPGELDPGMQKLHFCKQKRSREKNRLGTNLLGINF